MKNITKGFTLIELLVVITIIGILATGAVTVFTSQIQKARDTTRINDVKALQTAVEQTYQDFAAYPMASGATSEFFVTATADYIELIPEDPKFGQNCRVAEGTTTGTECAYAYSVDQVDGIARGRYELSTGFEAAGSVKSKAGSGSDNGDDDARFELGINVGSGVTVVAQGTIDDSTNCDSSTVVDVLILSKNCN